MTYTEAIRFLARNMIPTWVVSKDEDNVGIQLVAAMYKIKTEDVVDDVWAAYKLSHPRREQ